MLAASFPELHIACAQNLEAGNTDWVETTPEVYQTLANSLTLSPALQRGHSFALGQPTRKDAQGRSVHLCLLYNGNPQNPPKARYLTLKEFVPLLIK